MKIRQLSAVDSMVGEGWYKTDIYGYILKLHTDTVAFTDMTLGLFIKAQLNVLATWSNVHINVHINLHYLFCQKNPH